MVSLALLSQPFNGRSTYGFPDECTESSAEGENARFVVSAYGLDETVFAPDAQALDDESV